MRLINLMILIKVLEQYPDAETNSRNCYDKEVKNISILSTVINDEWASTWRQGSATFNPQVFFSDAA